MTEAIPYLLSGVIIVYALFILYFTYGWLKTKHPVTTGVSHLFVSIVVAVRNEAEQVGTLLTCLSRQNYPCHQFEVIVSDDSSDDQTPHIVEQFACRHPNIRLIRAQEKYPHGKKAALHRAIESASGELILTTDGDCTMGGKWLSSMVQHYISSGAAFLMGPVNIYRTKGGWLDQMQTLEFMSIMGVTGGAAGTGKPVLCNGANLAFRRDTWQQVRHQVAGRSYLSGDDVFLLHAFKKRFPGRILFVKDRNAVVTTTPSYNIVEFFSQRSRWAGKSAGFTDAFTLATGLITALTSLMLIASVIWNIFVPASFYSTLAAWGIKMAADFLLLWPVAGFFQQRKLMRHFPFLSVLYPFYVVTTIVLAIFFPAKWKKRSLTFKG
ncbi:MAG: glycosyltransferase [Bacteroidota bacterium]